MADDTDLEFKIVFIGDSGVGKTCILQRIDSNSFTVSSVSTIGMDLVSKFVDSNGYKVKLQLWDTAGQERFRAMVKLHSRGARGVFIVYAVNDQESFDAVNEFYQGLTSDSQMQKPFCVLIANKVDMHGERVVSAKQGKDLAKSLGMAYFETSAKTGAGIQESVQFMTDELVKLVESTQTQLPTRAKSGLLQKSPFRVEPEPATQQGGIGGMCSC